MNLKLAIIIPLILILLISTVPASSAFHPEHESWLGSQHYIDRYNNEENYRKWFDTYYGSNYTSIYEAVGVQEPWQLTEIRNQKEMILAQAQVLQQILDQLQDQSKLIRAFNEPVSNMVQEPGSQGSDPLIVEQMKKLNERLDKQEHEITSLNKTMSMAQAPGSQAAQSDFEVDAELNDPVIVEQKKKLHKEMLSYKSEWIQARDDAGDDATWDYDNVDEPVIGASWWLQSYDKSIERIKKEILDYEEDRKRDEEKRKRDEEKRKRDEKMRIEDEEIEEFLRIEKAQKLKEEKQQKEIDDPRQKWNDYQTEVEGLITSPQKHLYEESPLDYGLPPNPFSPIYTYPENYTHEEVVQFYKDMANFQKKILEMIQAQDPIVGAKPSSSD